MPHVDLSSLPGLADIPDPLLVLMALGLAGLLVILRFDAERFNAAHDYIVNDMLEAELGVAVAVPVRI